MKVGFYCEDEDGLVTRLDRELPEECASITTLLSEFRNFLRGSGYLEECTNMIQYIKWNSVSWNVNIELDEGDWILVCNENNKEVWATRYTDETFKSSQGITHWANMPYAYGEYIWEEE